jgi:hypothetical protein
MNLESLTKWISAHIQRRLREMPSQLAKDVYAISLYMDVAEQEITFSVNTYSQVELALAGKSKGYGLPSGELEARWNYAFWMQEPGSRFLTPSESEDAKLWNSVLEKLGLQYSDKDDFDIENYEIGVAKALSELSIKVSLALHASGIIQEVFHRDIPVIIHQLEYDDAIADITESANPAGVAAEFVAWVRNGA